MEKEPDYGIAFPGEAIEVMPTRHGAQLKALYEAVDYLLNLRGVDETVYHKNLKEAFEG